jgi:uncharacterized SAM-binding protein YcdF (DUF218 family)
MEKEQQVKQRRAVSSSVTSAAPTALAAGKYHRKASFSTLGQQRAVILAAISVCIACIMAISAPYFAHFPLMSWQQSVLTVSNVQMSADFCQGQDAIVVLGHSISHRRAVPSPWLAHRLEMALQLCCFHDPANSIGTIIFSGGRADYVGIGLRSEAWGMAHLFRRRWEEGPYAECAKRRPMPKIVLEEHSTSTRENARFTLEWIIANDWSKAKTAGPQERGSSAEAQDVSLKPLTNLVIVTNGFHQYRSLKVFEEVERSRAWEYDKIRKELSDHTLNSPPILVPLYDYRFNFTMAPTAKEEMEMLQQSHFWIEMATIAYYRMRRWIQF